MIIELLSVLVAVLAFITGGLAFRLCRNRGMVKYAQETAGRWWQKMMEEKHTADTLRRMIERLPSELRRRIGTTLNAADTSNMTARRPVTLEDLFPSWWLMELLYRRGFDVTLTASKGDARTEQLASALNTDERTEVIPLRSREEVCDRAYRHADHYYMRAGEQMKCPGVGEYASQ